MALAVTGPDCDRVAGDGEGVANSLNEVMSDFLTCALEACQCHLGPLSQAGAGPKVHPRPGLRTSGGWAQVPSLRFISPLFLGGREFL